MKKMMISVLGAVIISATVLTGCSVIRKGEEDGNRTGITQEQPEEKPKENPKEDMETVEGREEKQEEKKDQEDELAIRLSGLPEEALSVMGCTQEELAEALKKWTEENGYSSATGAEFHDPMWIRFGEGRYSMDCRLAIGNEGNGVSAEAESIVLTLDVFKEKNQIQFHQ